MRVLIACVAATMLFVVSCHEESTHIYDFVMGCEIAKRGVKIPPDGVVVTRGHVVTWRNSSDNTVTVKVSDADVLGGRDSIRLEPGESVDVRVGSGAAKEWELRWICWHIATSGEDEGDPVEEGEGGGPGRTEDTPPN